MQPWTEDPKTQRDAKQPRAATHKAAETFGGNRTFVGALAAMQSFSGAMLQEMPHLNLSPRSRLRKELAFIGDDNLANLDAVKNLMTMGRKQEYLCFGGATELEKLLPGVKVHVLGPPTIEQTDKIKNQRSRDPDEFWHLMGLSSNCFQGGGKSPFNGRWVKKGILPPWARWLVPKMQRNRASQLLELVRILDDAMNNTSLIILFEVGGKSFLFPGDAQIENWNYALKDARNHATICKLLAQVDFYKVGHHGSLNATPKTLYGLFAKKGKQGDVDRLTAVVSTMPGKHGSTEAGTEVPRRPLMEALARDTDFFSTTELKRGTKAADKNRALCKDMSFSLKRRKSALT